MANRVRCSGGPYCRAYNCHTCYYNHILGTKKKSMFNFPADEERCKEWVKNIGVQSLVGIPSKKLNNGSYKVCQLHFEDWCFTNEHKKRLNWNAVPRIFNVPNPSMLTPKRPSPKIHTALPPPKRHKAKGAAEMDFSSHSADQQGNQGPHSHSADYTHCTVTEGLMKQEHNIDISHDSPADDADDMAEGSIVGNEDGEVNIKIEEPSNRETEMSDNGEQSTRGPEDILDIKSEVIQDCKQWIISYKESVTIKSEVIDYVGQRTLSNEESVTIKSEVIDYVGQRTLSNEEPVTIKSEVMEDGGQGIISSKEPVTIKSEVMEDGGQGIISNKEPVTIKSEVMEDGGQGIVSNKEPVTVKLEVIGDGGQGISNEEPMAVKSEMFENCADVLQSKLEVIEHFDPRVALSDTCKDEPDRISEMEGDGDEIRTEIDPDLHVGIDRDIRVNKSHTRSKDKTHKCTMCGKSYWRKSFLLQHELLHSREKLNPFSCTMCGQSFSQKSSLTQHEVMHTEEKRFSCTVCGKSYSHKNVLKVHGLSHTGEKPHSCTVCGKSFNRRDTLTQHELLHTGEKPFSCTVCGKSFNQKSNLRRHKTVHP